MVKITKQNFLTNKFNRSNTNKILKILNDFVDSSTTPKQFGTYSIMKVNSLSDEANEFCWYVGKNPAYHIQYQIDSVAILKVNDFAVIVWKPKFIQYPTIVQFPQIKDIKNQSLRLEVDRQVTNLVEGNLNALLDFLQKFISTYKNDKDFQTNLATYTKHFASKKTAISYWHCIYDDDSKAALKDQKKMDCIAKIRVSGIKKGYSKCLYVFSCKGEREGVLQTITKKWTQTLSFIAMVMIFISVVSCSSEDTEGFCKYRDEVMVGGAGLMMALFGLKFANRKKKPAPKPKES